jgi:RHS repeat-associated protein
MPTVKINQTRSHSAYGHFSTTALPQTILGFNGEPLDRLFRDAYFLGNGHRIYRSLLMRFLSPDPESPFYSGGLNSYCFALGDPINGSDPSGRFTIFRKTKTYKGEKIPVPDLPGVAFYTANPRSSNGKTLNIAGHGSELNASTIITTLTASNIPIHNQEIHLISCYSASQLANISKKTGTIATGYNGPVFATIKITKKQKVTIKLTERRSIAPWLSKETSAKKIRTSTTSQPYNINNSIERTRVTHK